MLVHSKRPWNEIYDDLSLSKTYWATQVVIEKTDNRSATGLRYQSYIILSVSETFLVTQLDSGSWGTHGC